MFIRFLFYPILISFFVSFLCSVLCGGLTVRHPTVFKKIFSFPQPLQRSVAATIALQLWDDGRVIGFAHLNA